MERCIPNQTPRKLRIRSNAIALATPLICYRRPTDPRSRPQRWHDAVAELLALQAEYAAWSDTLPESLSKTPTAEALQAIVELDLSDLAVIQPPRGFGRD